ncbi:MAG: MoxR family ATPase, partial [Bacteroidota bacterium]|nr:MoxR family ATPase [Bacteroidota bacterium]
VEQEGTYPLPEAQVDRFMLKTVITYPKMEEERIVMRQNLSMDRARIQPVVRLEQIMKARGVVREIYMDEKIEKYILDIVFATRTPRDYRLPDLEGMIRFGASPRGSINLALASKALAFLRHRGYVIPEDVRAMAYPVLRHRIGLTYEAEAENVSTQDVIREILNAIEIP